ncbi:hypothetical protein [Kribbella sp. NPDC004536]|uniref:hypothetical protein n=1 Tax=Kribbella sp. NPDC004536 TaxID=3364106 RepID=UPI00369B1FB9
MRYNPPPNWPAPPHGWRPGPGWQPDPDWGPPPPGWKFWVPHNSWDRAFSRAYAWSAAIGVPVCAWIVLRGGSGVFEAFGFALAPAGVATLARISPFRWPLFLYAPAVLFGGLLVAQYFIDQPAPVP